MQQLGPLGFLENAMRWKLACLGVLFCSTPLLAAGTRPSGTATDRPFDPVEAQNYAQYVFAAIDYVAKNYVREVSARDLTLTAVTGMYEAARQPLPRELADAVKKAETEGDIRQLLAVARQRLGEREGLKGTDAALVSVRALLATLDPYSAVVSAEETVRSPTELLETGVGLELVDNVGTGPVVVKTVVPGSPAQRAGMRPGDQIIALNGRKTEGMAPAAVQALLNPAAERGRPRPPIEEGADDLRLTFLRRDGKGSRTVTVDRVPFRAETIFGVRRHADNSWNFFVERSRGIAQVRLGQLDHGTAQELLAVLRGLRAERVRGLILDLRGCPGGYLNEASSIAGLFLKEGTLVATITYRDPQRNEQHQAKVEESFPDLPMVVLVNGETSGGGELIAATLQDHGRARIVGQRTRGKASVQSMTSLPIGLGLKLTTGTFRRPNGKNLHRFPDSQLGDDWGVVPEPKDEFRISGDFGERLKEWWLLQTLRPASSNEALPLDDPTADPQRQAALRALLEQMKPKDAS
jgi:carboxyl-terminal processing protease